jgi:hypothetical protein
VVVVEAESVVTVDITAADRGLLLAFWDIDGGSRDRQQQIEAAEL